MEGKGGELHGELHPSVKVKGEHHTRPGHCVKVKVNRLHCKALLVSSALQSQEMGMGQQDFQVAPTGLAAKNQKSVSYRFFDIRAHNAMNACVKFR